MRFDDAMKVSLHGLNLVEQYYGKNHYLAVVFLERIIACLQYQEKFDEVEPWFEKSSETTTNSLKCDDSIMVFIQRKYAIILRHLEKQKKADELAQ